MKLRRRVVVPVIAIAALLIVGLVVILISLLKIQQISVSHNQPAYQAQELYTRAVDQINHGSYSSAEDYLQQALLKQDDATYRNQLAVVEYRLKKYPEAIAQYTKLVALKQDLGFSYNGIGNAYRDWGGHNAEAETAYNQAIVADPHYIAAYSNLALLQSSEGKKTDAEATIAHGITANPNSADELKAVQKNL